MHIAHRARSNSRPFAFAERPNGAIDAAAAALKSTERNGRTKCPFYDRFHLAAKAKATVETAPIFLPLGAEAHKQARYNRGLALLP